MPARGAYIAAVGTIRCPPADAGAPEDFPGPMRITTVDAFTDRPFAGNPSAVVVLERPAPEGWMRALAAEMNLSETAFLVPGEGAWGLRWFTPTVEIDLCGHATLAAAHVLFETGRAAEGGAAHFDTRSGRLSVRQEGARLAMDFPATPPQAWAPPTALAEALGAWPVWTGITRFDAFAVLPSALDVRALDPDHGQLAALGMRGVIVTAQAGPDEDLDVVSRFFAPGAGVPEDPVTGSAHCAIGPYWAGRLKTDTLRCQQASARGGTLEVRVRGDRVDLVGQAVTTYTAELAAAAGPGAWSVERGPLA